MKQTINFRHTHWAAGAFVILFAAIGTFLLLFSHAANVPNASVSASSGTLGGSAALKTDVGTSSGKYVQFGTPASTPAFQVGLGMRIWQSNDTAAANVVHPKLVRFELSTSDASTGSSVGSNWVNFYAGLSALPQPVVDFNSIPSNATVDAVAAWAKTQAGKIKIVEWGNEDSYTYKYGDSPGNSSYTARAQAYALSVQRLGSDLAGSGIGVVAQADDGDTGSSSWVDQMFAAVPDLQNDVTGWTLHPYGTAYMNRINNLVNQVGAHTTAVVKPIYITEWGLATDNGRTLSDNNNYPKNMTYQQAADTINSVVPSIAATGKVAEFMIYQSSDQSASGTSTDREQYFGVVQADGSTPKGAYTTAAASLLSTYHP